MPQGHIVEVLGRIFGVVWHQTTVTKTESGARPLRLSEAVAVAHILGVPLTDLIDETAASTASRGRHAAIRELRLMRSQVDKRITELQES